MHEPQLRASGLPRIGFLPCATLLVLLGIARAAFGDEPVTLPAAIAEALAANARLPLSAIELSLAGEREKEARAERWLKLAVEGDFIYAPPGYSDPITNLGEARLQAVGAAADLRGRAPSTPPWPRRGRASRAADARYRMAEKDLELEVRSRFGELLQAESEIEIRRAGLDQLGTYRTLLRSRQASGQGVASDVLKTEVRIELEEAAVIEAEQRADEARVALNDLMGRDPAAPLVLAPLPDPMPPGALDADSWENAPDVEAARAGRAPPTPTSSSRPPSGGRSSLLGRRGLPHRRHDPPELASSGTGSGGTPATRSRSSSRGRSSTSARRRRARRRRASARSRRASSSRASGATRACRGRRRAPPASASTRGSSSSRAPSPTPATPISRRRAGTAAGRSPRSRSSTRTPPRSTRPSVCSEDVARYRIARGRRCPLEHAVRRAVLLIALVSALACSRREGDAEADRAGGDARERGRTAAASRFRSGSPPSRGRPSSRP